MAKPWRSKNARFNLTLAARPQLPLVLLLGLAFSAAGENWPCWRGPRMDGTSAETNVPVHWSATSNIVWETELPGSGHASPIVWENRIFTVAAIAEQEARVLLCFNRADGKILWQKTVVVAPFEGKHKLNSHASSTAATDGECVYVDFLDRKEMLDAAYDVSGKEHWPGRR